MTVKEAMESEQTLIKYWINDNGIRINKGCFSCMYSGANITEKQKMCELAGVRMPRRHICSRWEPLEQYRCAGGARSYTGTKAEPGKVKTPGYLAFACMKMEMGETVGLNTQKVYEESTGLPVYWKI